MSPSPPAFLPTPAEYAPFYATYIAALGDADIMDVLERQESELSALLKPLSEEQVGFRYAEGKWSIREVVGHMADAERIFGTRMLRFARGDQAPLPGFDEKPYVAASSYDAWTMADLLDQFAALRQANLLLIRHLDEVALLRAGRASGQEVSVRALVAILAGHAAHHLRVLRERYLAD
ncbi:MAG: DinB family protein [Rhodothermaceae bacterium]|nr:DinB family protein [Rhodothermaceae bacterium]